MDEESLVKKRNKAQRDGNLQVLADVEKKLGDLYFDKKSYEDALEAYKGQLQACESLSDRLNCAIAHRMIGEVYADIGDFSEALSHQNLYLELAKELEDLIEEQRAFATIGRTHLLVADSYVKESEKEQKMEVLRDAKKAFSKSIRLCDKLENKIDVGELMTMRARLLLNLGLVLEQQKDTEQALSLIKQALSLCKKHNLHEDLHRTNMALAGLNERLGNCELAIKNLDDAAKVDEIYLKADAQLSKAELLLKLGEWMEAQKILHHLYKSKRLLESVRQQVTKLLRIAVVLCRNEDKLLIEDNLSVQEKIYETMGDAAVAVRSLDKAEYYYQNMLTCAKKTNSGQIGAALTSLAQTLRDAGKFQEAVSYGRKELEICKTEKETATCALYLAGLLVDANSSDQEIREMYNRALTSAKACEDSILEKSVIADLIEYLEKSNVADMNEIESLRERLGDFPSTISDYAESEESDTPDIGADICLDELSDLEENVSKNETKIVFKSTTRRTRCVVKKNEKGESLLHVACIKGNIAMVEKLLEEQHPTDVRDHCGWTPLHEASNHGFVDIVRALVRAGADVNDPGGANCDGVTALHDAAANGHTAIVQLLLDNGANPNLLTRGGESALECLEQWRERVGELSPRELRDYVHAKRRLSSLISVKRKKKARPKPLPERRWNALVDEEEDADVVDRRGITLDSWADESENISAGEDYKRTIASMQHPGRMKSLGSMKQSTFPRITAPLIDSEEVLVDDWLEEDVLPSKRRDKPLHPETLPALSAPTKRKSKTDSDLELERDVDKCTKRPKVGASTLAKEPSAMVDEGSCNSSSSEPIMDSFSELATNWPKKRLTKKRQTNLLRQGFTKNVRSRSPSPDYRRSPEPMPAMLRVDQERHSWDSNCVSETIDLEILVDEEIFDLKLHMRDLRKTMKDIEELIKHKFEAKTGCRPEMKFNTADGVVLAPEVLLEEVPKEKNKLKLLGKITKNDLPLIVDRYKKVCETLGVSVSSSMLKSLKSCDNTSTFRLNASESACEELEPLVKCLHYQRNLQSLNLSSATFFNNGELLNYAISELPGLCELHLQCCDIDVECLSKISRLPPQIRVLDLGYNPFGSGAQRKLYELLEPLKRLQTLCLRSCGLDGFEYTFTSSSLVDLDISWNPIGGNGACNFLQRQLLNLNLSNTQNFKYDRTNVIDKIFFTDALKYSFITLESLELSSCQATDLDVEKILSQTPNLTKINLSNNVNVTKTSLCAILAKKPTMSYVDLSGCRLIDEPPDANLRLVTPQVCTLFVHMKLDVIDDWERLWQGKGYSKKLPHCLVTFKPK